MTGILISALYHIFCGPKPWVRTSAWRLDARGLGILISSILVIYKTYQLLIRPIQCRGLVLAAILDVAFVIFLVTPPNPGPLGPGLGREND